MMMGKRVLVAVQVGKCPRMGSDTISNPGGQSTQTSRTVSDAMTDISAVKKVTIPFTECLEKGGIF